MARIIAASEVLGATALAQSALVPHLPADPPKQPQQTNGASRREIPSIHLHTRFSPSRSCGFHPFGFPPPEIDTLPSTPVPEPKPEPVLEPAVTRAPVVSSHVERARGSAHLHHTVLKDVGHNRRNRSIGAKAPRTCGRGAPAFKHLPAKKDQPKLFAFFTRETQSTPAGGQLTQI